MVGRIGPRPGVPWVRGGGRGRAARPLSPRCRGRSTGGGVPRLCGADLSSGPERATRACPGGGRGAGGQGSRPPAVLVAVGARPSQRDPVLPVRWGVSAAEEQGTAAAASPALPCGEREYGDRRRAPPAAAPLARSGLSPVPTAAVAPRGFGCASVCSGVVERK